MPSRSTSNMQPEYFKLQTPVYSTETQAMVLLYNQKRTLCAEIDGEMATQLITDLGMKPAGDKVYVQAMIRGGVFIANKDTLTRTPEQIGIDW
jgi:hypothetical protein